MLSTELATYQGHTIVELPQALGGQSNTIDRDDLRPLCELPLSTRTEINFTQFDNNDKRVREFLCNSYHFQESISCTNTHTNNDYAPLSFNKRSRATSDIYQLEAPPNSRIPYQINRALAQSIHNYISSTFNHDSASILILESHLVMG